MTAVWGLAAARFSAGRQPAFDLVSHINRAIGNRRRNDCSIDKGAVIGSAVLGTDESWVKFLAGIGAIVLTFLADAELDPQVFKLKWNEAPAVGFGLLRCGSWDCRRARPHFRALHD
jgi:hypothetical protein